MNKTILLNETKYCMHLPLRIDWSDMDMYRHVNNVMFAKYIQASRINYWEQIGLNSFFNRESLGPMLASTTIHFKQPLYYPGNINVWARVDEIKNTSFSIRHVVLNDKKNICAEAVDIIVMFDFNNNMKIRVPNWLREKVNQTEGRVV